MERAHETDESLMQQVALGRCEQLDVLLQRHAQPLLTFLRRMSGDHHRSEELFQEVFLAVWTGRDRYEYPRPFRPWLFGIAWNKCRAEQRQRAGAPCSLDDDAEAAPADRGPAPFEVAIALETATLVERAVQQLPAQQRSVLALRVWNGLSYAEIAAVIGRTEATVRSTMFHALAALRRHLEPHLR